MFKSGEKSKKNIGSYMQTGMTYVELIVVLGIFAVMSAIVMFNYGEFQAKVDIKNWAGDIALKIVEAQKSSLSGVLSSHTPVVIPWKPSYGVYFSTVSVNGADNKNFIYFADLDQSEDFDGAICTASSECLDIITITKGNLIEKIEKCADAGCSSPVSIDTLSVVFKRPDSRAIFSTSPSLTVTGSEYVQMTIKSPKTATAKIKIYPSGRIQVN